MSLYTEYKKSLKMLEVEEVLDLIIFRPPAFLLVKLIYQTSITPNQITWVSLFFGIFGAFLITFGTATAFILAAICFIIYNILDCSDGQLARLQSSGTLTGRIVDGFADYIVAVTSYLAIGVGYASNTNDPFFTGLLPLLPASAMLYTPLRWIITVINFWIMPSIEKVFWEKIWSSSKRNIKGLSP